jgi:glutaredoxin
MAESDVKTATIYRMVMPEHLCPFGLKSVDLLKRKGYRIDDRWLKTRAEHDAFKAAHMVETTPQTFIGGKRIGGYEDLKRFFGMPAADPNAVSYRPVVVVFAVAALMSLAVSWATSGALLTIRSGEWFIAFSMCILALLKLQDIESFSTMFLGYDLLARRLVRYSYFYPYGELLAGVLMVAGALIWISVPVALFIGVIGAISVFKAVYVDKRALKCACVGGNSKVPLGFVSLTENLMMIAMAFWMVARHA